MDSLVHVCVCVHVSLVTGHPFYPHTTEFLTIQSQGILFK